MSEQEQVMHPYNCTCVVCLVDRSSLGTPGAKAARKSVSDEQVARVMDRMCELDDVEALARVILPVLPNHCCEPGDVTDCPYDAHDASSIAQAILDSDWLAARDRAAERPGAVKELRGIAAQISSAIPTMRGDHVLPYDRLSSWLRERADRIEAGS